MQIKYLNQKRYLNLVIWLVLSIIIIGATASSTMAASYYEYIANQKIKVKLSKDYLNRISFDKCFVAEVIGDENKYQMLLSEDKSNIFIMPKTIVGEVFTISIIDSIGRVQDIELEAANIHSQTIIISSPIIKSDQISEQEEISKMLKNMSLGKKDKYYVKAHKQQLITKLSERGLQITKVKTYQYKDLYGVILLAKNMNKNPIEIQEEDFKDIFTRPIAVSLVNANAGSLRLSPKKQAKALIITKGQE